MVLNANLKGRFTVEKTGDEYKVTVSEFADIFLAEAESDKIKAELGIEVYVGY
jgi:hypothetical protein